MRAAPSLLRLDQQICFALYTSSRAVIRAYTPLLGPLGLTYPQYLVMLALWEEDAISVRRLGEQLSLDSATLTPLLKRLEQQGTVARHRDERDERVVRIHLTNRGRALRSEAEGVPLALACRAGFDPGDRRAAARHGRLRQELNALTLRMQGSPKSSKSPGSPRRSPRRG